MAVGRELTQLTSLQLYDTNVTGAGVSSLSKLIALEEINFLGSARVDAGALQNLSGLPNVTTLMLCGTSVGDGDAAELPKLQNLEGLNLQGTKVTDAGLAYLADCPKLKAIALAGAISDEGVQSLGGLKNLEFLWLDGVGVTDKSAPVLAGLERPHELLIQRTAITDAGAIQLCRLKNLLKLRLGSQVSDEAAAEIRAALPECEIMLIGQAGKERLAK